MAEYADSITPPKWWLEELERIITDDDLNDRKLADRANIEAPGESWDRSRIHKMRSGKTGWTRPIILAISRALKIPSHRDPDRSQGGGGARAMAPRAPNVDESPD